MWDDSYLGATVTRKIKELVAALTLDEKAELLAGADLWSTKPIERLDVPRVQLTDGPNGARGATLPSSISGAKDSMTSVCMPCGTALGATWDLELIDRVGSVIGAEARMKQCRVLLAPTVNLHRSPLGGRNFESYSEDPLLAGRLGAAFVRGAQRHDVACTVKHFAGNEYEEGRMVTDSVIDGRTLREMYLLPFEITVRDGGARGVMTAYNRLNGEYCTDSRWLLQEVLRDEWGFTGIVVSDWFGFADSAAAARAGLDLEMPGPARAYGPALAEAVRSGELDEKVLDATIERLLGLFDELGALDDSATAASTSEQPRTHLEVAHEAAISSIVLLHNDGALPLDAVPIRRVAVIGPNAGRAVIMGGGSSSLSVPEPTTPIEAIVARLAPDVHVVHEPGVDISLTTPEFPAEWISHGGEPGMRVECFAPTDPTVCLHSEQVATGTVQWFATPPNVKGEFTWSASTTLTVPSPGRWTISLAQTEPARLLIDGRVVIDTAGQSLPPGHDLFGTARREQTIDLDLSPERPVGIELTSSARPGGTILGAKLGIRAALPETSIDDAVAAALESDTVIVVVGTDGTWESEGHDRESMTLPGRQDELIERVLDVAPEAIVVLNTGSPVAVPWAQRCGALLQCWFGGIEMADALADVIFGTEEPGGRLPTTMPRRVEDNPTWGNFSPEGGRVLYGERLLVGYRWYESRAIEVAFPFGHGLSYTTFEIGELALSTSSFTPGGTLTVTIPVANTGKRSGSEVVQLYVAPIDPPVLRPAKELKAFAKVKLEPGERTVVELQLDDRSFARWAETDPAYPALVHRQGSDATWMPRPPDAEPTGWTVDAGRYDLLIGRSSHRIDQQVAVEVS